MGRASAMFGGLLVGVSRVGSMLHPDSSLRPSAPYPRGDQAYARDLSCPVRFVREDTSDKQLAITASRHARVYPSPK